MPIKVDANIHHLDQNAFGEVAWGVMDHVFAVHNTMGRFLNEDIYRDAVAIRVGGDSKTEVLIEVMFDDFCKEYYLDLTTSIGSISRELWLRFEQLRSNDRKIDDRKMEGFPIL